jgi:short subunit dehydrogenase-like uncharacterized protein
MPPKFDIVIYGATGFTGRLVAEYLCGGRAAAAGVTVAVAGRDSARVSALAASLGGGVGALSGPPDAIAARARVVLTTVGPYLRYGEPMLAACISAGADYCDLTGETPWAAAMDAQYAGAAAAARVTVIQMSGFDSIPADASVWLAADAARRVLGAGVARARGFFTGDAGASGGTLASGLGVFSSPALAAVARNPTLLFPAAAVAAAGTGSAASLVAPLPDAAWPFYEPALRGAAAPFVMAAINTRVVRRSAGLLAAHARALAGHAHALAPLPAGAAVAPSTAPTGTYSPRSPFAFSEHMLIGGGRVLATAGAWAVLVVLALGELLLALPGAARIAAAIMPKPGSGPSPARRARSRWTYTLLATADDAAASTVAVRASGKCPVSANFAERSGGVSLVTPSWGLLPLPPPHPAFPTPRLSPPLQGYGDTAKMLSEVGILLATERAGLPAAAIGGGFLTPAVALGRRLPDVLNAHAGVKMEVVYAGPSPLPAGALL